MFSAQTGISFNSLLSQATSAFSTCQSYLAGRLTRHRPTSAFNPLDTASFSSQQTIRESQECNVEISSSFPTLRGFGLQNLPKDWRELLALDSNVCRLDRRSHWKISYVSAQSFFENKHGFSPDLIASSSRGAKCRLFNGFDFNKCHSSILTQLSPSCSPHHQQIRRLTQMAQGMLFNLERLANNHPRNAEIQATYLQAVVTEDPQYVVRRYESGLYASSEECSRVYQKAKRLSASTHKSVSSDSLLGNRQERLLGAEQSSLGGLGTENKPLHVVQASSKGSFFWKQVFNALKYILGLIILVSVFDAAFQMRGMTANHKSILPDRSDRKYRFADVQGVDEAKEELQEVVEFLRSPDKFRRLGGKLPKGVLLIGPPGTGKTLLARAVAGEAGVPFFFCSGSEFDEMFVGVGAARVRNLFSAAKEHAPCIVFVDELDAIGGRRVKNDVQPYSRMTLNQLLVEMDGFEQNSGVVVIGATNFPEVLDEALVRPGRFDSKISITMPDVKARYDILKVHVKEVPLASDVDLEILARGTSGMTGADLAGLVNQAAIRSSALGHDDITMLELEWAKDKIIMGPERKSAIIDDECKRIVAFHEAGHALVAIHTDGALPVHKATIMPRGPALGMVAQLPEKDELLLSKKQLLAKMDVAMAGRVAEEIIFGPDSVTTGASSDFEQATAVARSMVSRFGMSDKIGPVLHKLDSQLEVGPETRQLIEAEVKRILQESYDRAVSVLRKHASQHQLLAEALLKYETLTSDEIKTIIAGKNIDRKL